MVKLLICLFGASAIGLYVLQLRQQQLELGYQTAQLHEKINNQQAKLWNQQLQIAVFTAPNAIEKTVKGQQMDMVPVYSVKPTETDDDAEWCRGDARADSHVENTLRLPAASRLNGARRKQTTGRVHVTRNVSMTGCSYFGFSFSRDAQRRRVSDRIPFSPQLETQIDSATTIARVLHVVPFTGRLHIVQFNQSNSRIIRPTGNRRDVERRPSRDDVFEQAIILYNIKTPPEKQLAEAMAAQMLATAKLESAVRERWGNDAKNRISHLCMDSTAEDVAQATWTITSHHAVARFKPDGMSPLLMIRVNGTWKIDVAAYVADLGDQLQPALRIMKGTTGPISAYTDDLVKRKSYATVNYTSQASGSRLQSAPRCPVALLS